MSARHLLARLRYRITRNLSDGSVERLLHFMVHDIGGSHKWNRVNHWSNHTAENCTESTTHTECSGSMFRARRACDTNFVSVVVITLAVDVVLAISADSGVIGTVMAAGG